MVKHSEQYTAVVWTSVIATAIDISLVDTVAAIILTDRTRRGLVSARFHSLIIYM